MIDESIHDPDPSARRELLQALALAFRDNPMNVAIHGPRAGRRVRANRGGLRALVLDTAGQAATRVIRDQGKVIGGFVAAPPGLFPIVTPSLTRQISCFFAQGVHAMDRWTRVSSRLGDFRPDDEHWYLAVLGVIPEFQGRGFGGRLIDELDRMIAIDPRPVYLESDRESSVRFYRRRGFGVRQKETLGGVECWCLGRGFAGETPNLCDSVRET